MISDIQNNREQLEMLLMTLTEVPCGICLFQSCNQEKWVSLIQKRLVEKEIITHNIADDSQKDGMVNSQDFRKWASESDAAIVIVYNVQLLGVRFGDEEVVEKLNFMRDQILAIGKLFVLGVSPYFNQLLSRNARDLYSCILHHFIFQDPVEEMIGIPYLDIENLSVDDKLEMERYRETKERIENNQGKKEIFICLTCIKSWRMIRDGLSGEEDNFIKAAAEIVDEWYINKEMKIADLENIWILAKTWLMLGNTQRSAYWYKAVLDFVEKKLGSEHEIYAQALVESANYYQAANDYIMCEQFCNQAIEIYCKKNLKDSAGNRLALRRKAAICGKLLKFQEALHIYERLLGDSISRYGENYYGNAYLYHSMGRVYEEQKDFSNALQCFQKAFEILNNAGKQGLLTAAICQNICVLYLKNGDGRAAWKHIKKAEKIIEAVYGKESNFLIKIYHNMSEVCHIRGQPEKELVYQQKALALRNHMEKIFTPI